MTFLKSSLPVLGPGVTSAEAIWINGLTQTYAAELRPERAERARQLVQLNLDDYALLTRRAAPALAGMLEVVAGENYRCLTDEPARQQSLWHWRLRRWQGKVLSVLRLTKAAFTFSNSISYAAWKIERHTGVRVESNADAAAASSAVGIKSFLEITAARGDALAGMRRAELRY